MRREGKKDDSAVPFPPNRPTPSLPPSCHCKTSWPLRLSPSQPLLASPLRVDAQHVHRLRPAARAVYFSKLVCACMSVCVCARACGCARVFICVRVCVFWTRVCVFVSTR